MSRQRVVKFGSVTPLTGVLCEPQEKAPRDRPAVVLLNSGILHHVGANRLHVQLARRLASRGFTSLRFDFSGLGDSEPRRDDLSFERSGPLETKDAIDYLVTSTGAQSVVLMGLCSGADVAHLTAVDDSRVVGLGLLDPWAYRTKMYFLHYYGSRLVTPSVYKHWINVRWNRVKNAIERVNAGGSPDPDMYEMPRYIREFPPRERVAADLVEFMKRDIELCLIFSGGLEEYNHQGQYRASFPEVNFGHRLSERHVPDAAHVFSALEHQEIVVSELSNWTTRCFAKSEGARSTSAHTNGLRDLAVASGHA